MMRQEKVIITRKWIWNFLDLTHHPVNANFRRADLAVYVQSDYVCKPFDDMP